MRFTTAYFKQRRKAVCVFLLFCAVFACAFALYHIPLGAVLYPALVCTVLGLLFYCLTAEARITKHNALVAVQAVSSALMDFLPRAVTQDDTDYQQIIQNLREEQQQLGDRMNQRFSDMVDYYTIWAHQIKTPIAAMRLTLQNEDSELSRMLLEELFRIEQYVDMVLCYLRSGFQCHRLCHPGV